MDAILGFSAGDGLCPCLFPATSKNTSYFDVYFAIFEKSGVVFYAHDKANKRKTYVTDQRGFMQANKNYLFVKCFTAKAKPRQQCGVYLAKDFLQHRKISTQNKINFPDKVLTKR